MASHQFSFPLGVPQQTISRWLDTSNAQSGKTCTDDPVVECHVKVSAAVRQLSRLMEGRLDVSFRSLNVRSENPNVLLWLVIVWGWPFDPPGRDRTPGLFQRLRRSKDLKRLHLEV